MTDGSILWRRLDAPGHDACRVGRIADGWVLDGAAAFQHAADPVSLSYRLEAALDWRTRSGTVHGWVGAQRVEQRIARSPDGAWSLNDEHVASLPGCVDLDLGFTPATNLFQLRRLGLKIGHTAEVPVAWLDVAAGSLDLLKQRYERRSAYTYWYEAPRFGYAGLLEINAVGFPSRYPGLWEAEVVPAGPTR